MFFAVQLGGLAGEILPEDFMMPGMTGHAVFILKLLSAMIGLWLWGLAFWSVLPAHVDDLISVLTRLLQVLSCICRQLLEIRPAGTRGQDRLPDDLLLFRFSKHGPVDRNISDRQCLQL